MGPLIEVQTGNANMLGEIDMSFARVLMVPYIYVLLILFNSSNSNSSGGDWKSFASKNVRLLSLLTFSVWSVFITPRCFLSSNLQ